MNETSFSINKEIIIHSSAFIAPDARLIGEIELKENSSVWYKAVLRADIAKIILGANSNIQDLCVCHVDFDKPVLIGSYVTIGHGVILHGCTIGDNSLIGMGAIVLDGAVIGNNCIVAAGSLVVKNTVIPDNSLVLGSPAKVIRTLEPDEIKKTTKNAQDYIDLAKLHRRYI